MIEVGSVADGDAGDAAIGGLLEAAGEAGFRFGPGLGGSSTVSDGSGRFRFDRLGAGRYSVSAALRGRSSSRVDLALQAGERREDVQVALVGGATLRGQVTGLEPALRASVNVFATGPEGYVSGVRPTADGSFTLGGVPVGSIDLRAKKKRGKE